MAKFIDKKVAKFVGYMDLDGNPLSDWHEEYLGCAGLLCIYESEHKAPGKKFIYFYPNEPEAELQRYFNSISGDITESDSKICLDTDRRYIFELGDFISEDDLILLALNVFVR